MILREEGASMLLRITTYKGLAHCPSSVLISISVDVLEEFVQCRITIQLLIFLLRESKQAVKRTGKDF